MEIYKVTYQCDSLDSNPTIKTFDAYGEMVDWVTEEVEHRVQFAVEHSPYAISEKERSEIQEWEYSLVRIEQV
jgi:hypothetical protein|tara:strand:- start:1006 stop:1224 length:219 start_codon:yes stop_codon:yes gene_type:complete